jgi:hypothetical protein
MELYALVRSTIRPTRQLNSTHLFVIFITFKSLKYQCWWLLLINWWTVCKDLPFSLNTTCTVVKDSFLHATCMTRCKGRSSSLLKEWLYVAQTIERSRKSLCEVTVEWTITCGCPRQGPKLHGKNKRQPVIYHTRSTQKGQEAVRARVGQQANFITKHWFQSTPFLAWIQYANKAIVTINSAYS